MTRIIKGEKSTPPAEGISFLAGFRTGALIWHIIFVIELYELGFIQLMIT
jgi:hypothetical protein